MYPWQRHIHSLDETNYSHSLANNTFSSIFFLLRYGYRGNDCRCNMYVLKSGELVYFMGRVAILYDNAKHGQRHYMEHTADIKW